MFYLNYCSSWLFLKVAITQVDLLSIEWIKFPKCVKQMYNQSKIDILNSNQWWRIDFNRDSGVKSLCWILSLCPPNPDLLQIVAVPSLQDLAIFKAPQGRGHLSSKYSGGLLCSSRQLAVLNTVQTFPGHISFERACHPSVLTYMLMQLSLALVFVGSTWSSLAVFHPSTLQPLCCFC